MGSQVCPFCQTSFALSPQTHLNRRLSFELLYEQLYGYVATGNKNGSLIADNHFFQCPDCEKTSIIVNLYINSVCVRTVNVHPASNAIVFPDYIPKSIRSDYREACAVVDLSPKASATLSRRCLQSMIRDFWSVSENNLYKSIDALKDKLPAKQWQVIDGIRRIGNIGAHMEKNIDMIIDIEPDEASKLLKMIELLIKQWYIERHEQEELYDDIIGIDETKQKERKGIE